VRAVRWSLLIHALPPHPLYLRARIHRRLLRAGAIALKDSVYVLPDRPSCLEELRSIAQEAVARGGRAFVCEAAFADSKVDGDLVEEFRRVRQADYKALASVLASGRRSDAGGLGRARRRLIEISRIDFFDAPGRARVESLLAAAASSGRSGANAGARDGDPDLVGRLWATRPGVQIDRIACAWLVRRFIDPEARFRFVDPREPRQAGELRFDMPGGDFSHEGDECTFEVLVRRIRNPDRALRQVAEIVHDVDIKDGKFARPEAAGVERLLIGLALANPEDPARLERGFVLFDELHQSFRKHTRTPSKEISK
jgi:hypothetical protein